MVDLKPDCENCAALCCLALAIDRSAMFAFDKLAGQPCHHLTSDFRCTIHDQLRQSGCLGCVRYDCLGAGQRVVNEVFAGQNWQDTPALKAPMIEAFAQMRALHEMVLLLETAMRYPLSRAQAARGATLLNAARGTQRLTPDRLRALERGPLAGDVRQFIHGLRPVAAGLKPGQ